MSQILHKYGVILERTENEFENFAVFNPAVLQQDNTLHLYYRAVREGNHSSIGYCKLEGPLNIIERLNQPILYPEFDYECQGVEDPRISKISDTYYLSYSAFDKTNVLGAFATSKDLMAFQKKGIITPKISIKEYENLITNKDEVERFEKYIKEDIIIKQSQINPRNAKSMVWDKNIVFFPRKLNQKTVVLHRLYPSIQILYFDTPEDLTYEFWRDYIKNLKAHTVLSSKYPHESGHIGAGCPPIETSAGWLLIYHSAEKTNSSYKYHACAALLSIKDPSKELARLDKPLFSPTLPYETDGHVNNVVFPTGTAVFDDELFIYYGAADTSVAVASINMSTLINRLLASI